MLDGGGGTNSAVGDSSTHDGKRFKDSDAPALGSMRLAGAVAGMAMVIYLVWAELFALDAICLWRTGVHILTFLLFVAVLFEANRPAHDAFLDPTEGISR